MPARAADILTAHGFQVLGSCALNEYKISTEASVKKHNRKATAVIAGEIFTLSAWESPGCIREC